MKYTNTTQTVVEYDPSLETGKFGIEINAKSFKILVDNIYRDKIKAVIRELSCNAFDSHIEANSNRPIDIHLPTHQEPFFYVQDYGVGLSEEGMKEVYTMFFASTKDKTNKYIGSLGIGAKSFYAYGTKTCTIESNKDGKKVIYSCYLDEKGIPSYTKLFSGETTDHNGVKISFPVEIKDFAAFIDKSFDVFKWFTIKPRFIGKQITFPSTEKILSGNGWYILSEVSERKPLLLMGNIAYEIESGDISLNKYNKFMNPGLVIEAKLGDVEFESAREGLSYTNKTVSFLKRMFSNIELELTSNVEKDIIDSRNYYEARKKYFNITKNLPYNIKNILHPVLNKVKFQQRYLSDKYEFHRGMTYFKYDSYRVTPRRCHTETFYDTFDIILDDLKVGSYVRSQLYVSTHKKNVILIKFEDDDDKKKFFDEAGCDDSNIILASTLPTISKAKRQSTKGINKTTIMSLNYNENRNTKMWEPLELSDNDKLNGAYVIRKNNSIKNTELISSIEEYIAYVPLGLSIVLKELNISVYGVTETQTEKAKKFGLKPLKEVLKNKINKNVLEKLLKVKNSDLNLSDSYYILDNLSSIKKDYNKKKIYEKIYLEHFSDIIKNYEDYTKLISSNNGNYISTFQILPQFIKTIFDDINKEKEIKVNTIKNKVEGSINSMVNKYPLFKKGRLSSDILFHYVLGVETCSKLS